MSNRKIILLVLTAFVGLIGGQVGSAFADGGDTALVHACVSNKNGSVKIVDADSTCPNGLAALHWNIMGPPGAEGDQGEPGPQGEKGDPGVAFCQYCDLSAARSGDRLAGRDLSDGNFWRTLFIGTNLANTNFDNAYLELAKMISADLSNASFAGAFLYSADLEAANLLNANFTNADAEGASFFNAENMETADVTGVSWLFATCPDGTSVDDTLQTTCEGHLEIP